jgi:hypothetical protein
MFFIEGSIDHSLLWCSGSPFHAAYAQPCQFLTPEEKAVALRRMKQDSHGAEKEIVDEEHFNWHWVCMALLNITQYVILCDGMVLPSHTSLCNCIAGGHRISSKIADLPNRAFLSSSQPALGYTATKAQLFTVPPNRVAFCCVLITAAFSDKFKMRGQFMIGVSLLAIIGYVHTARCEEG